MNPKSFPKAVYVHCFSHKLNLAIVKSCDIIAVRNAFGIISKFALFFNNSLKRWEAFVDKIKQLVQPNRNQNLLDLCKTKWIECHKALHNFGQFYEIVLQLFKETMSQSEWKQIQLLIHVLSY